MRIEVRFGGPVKQDDAVLVQEGCAPPDGAEIVAWFRVEERKIGHGAGCLCCVQRGAVAEALTRLYLDRARGTLPAFGRMVVVGDTNGKTTVRAALDGDVLLRARFFSEAETGANGGGNDGK